MYSEQDRGSTARIQMARGFPSIEWHLESNLPRLGAPCFMCNKISKKPSILYTTTSTEASLKPGVGEGKTLKTGDGSSSAQVICEHSTSFEF